MTIKATLKLHKVTRGAVRYEEVDEAGRPVITRKVGTVYIRKSALAGRRYPDVLEITMISR